MLKNWKKKKKLLEEKKKEKLLEELFIYWSLLGVFLLKTKDRIAKPAQIASNRHKDTKYSKSKFVLFMFFTISLELAIVFGYLFFSYKPYKPYT